MTFLIEAHTHLPIVGDVQPDGGKVLDLIVRTIGGWILGGRYGPGAILPREEDMAVSFAVSRTSVREAIKFLSAKGLVETRPRVGVRVRARDDWRMLDSTVLSWHPDLSRDTELVASLIEARRIIEPAAAELAARRGTAADLAAVEAAYLGMEGAIPLNLEACCDADLAFHRSIIAASHNIVLKSLIGTIETTLKASFLLTTSLMENQSRMLAMHKDVMDCIRFRDVAGARSTMNHLLDLAQQDLGRVEKKSDTVVNNATLRKST
jgi:GntR family transcriptional regulator, galactonate operon transcriptional repressor